MWPGEKRERSETGRERAEGELVKAGDDKPEAAGEESETADDDMTEEAVGGEDEGGV